VIVDAMQFISDEDGMSRDVIGVSSACCAIVLSFIPGGVGAELARSY